MENLVPGGGKDASLEFPDYVSESVVDDGFDLREGMGQGQSNVFCGVFEAQQVVLEVEGAAAIGAQVVEDAIPPQDAKVEHGDLCFFFFDVVSVDVVHGVYLSVEIRSVAWRAVFWQGWT